MKVETVSCWVAASNLPVRQNFVYLAPPKTEHNEKRLPWHSVAGTRQQLEELRERVEEIECLSRE